MKKAINFLKNIDLSKNFVYFTFFFIIAISQFAFFNITNLGLIADDWDGFMALYDSDKTLNGIFLNRFERVSYYVFLRPHRASFGILMYWVFQLRFYLYFIFSAFLHALSSFFIFKINIKLFKQHNFALMSSILFLTLPYHSATYYWISAHIAILSFCLALLSWLIVCYSKNYKDYFLQIETWMQSCPIGNHTSSYTYCTSEFSVRHQKI